jgi:hypothetical protein
MGWRDAKCLDVLLRQVDAAFPGRAKQNDGTIGDAAHQATHSEHNPDENGIVRARDITHDPAHGLDARKLAEALIASRDNRILYVISNAEICSSVVSPWKWRPYNGSNPHREHMHLSVVENPALYDDERPWRIDGHAIPPPPYVPLDQRTIDAIVAAAAASDLARYSWNDRGRAPIGYIKGMAVVFGQAVRKLAARDSAALAMVRIVNGPGDVFDHYEDIMVGKGMVTADAPEVDRLRALFVILTGLGMRESSGNYSEGRDMSASNVQSDTAEAGLFQMSWNAHTTSPEIPKLLDAYRANKHRGFIEIFREGVRDKATDDFGSGDGAAFQAIAKADPAFAVEAAAISLRTLYTHWGPIVRREAEVISEADTLFRQVQEIVGAIPATQGKPTVTDPISPTIPVVPPSVPAVLSPQIDVGRILQFVVDHEADAHRVLTIAIGLHNSLHPDRPVVMPGTAPETPAEPTQPSVLQRPSVQLGTAGLLITSVLQALGVVGMPVGEMATQTGTLATLFSLGTAALGATGGFGKLASIGINVLGALARASQQK